MIICDTQFLEKKGYIEQKVRCYQGGSSDSSGTTTPQATPQQMLALYNQYLPSTLATTTNQAPAIANELAGSAAGANPIYTASGLNQLNQYGTGYVNAGNNMSEQQAIGNANLVGGAGGLTALEGSWLNNLINPTQAADNTQATNLVNSYNLNGLSPGEFNATERANNQGLTSTGNLGINNGTNTISNAMNFGGAFNNKLNSLQGALNTATGVANAQNTQINPTATALAAGNTSANAGVNQLNTTQANSNLTVPFSAASALGNQIASVSSASKGTTSGSSAQGGVCFLTTVACKYKGLADDCLELTILRHFRETIVPREIVEEYKRIAPAIVQKIQDVKEHMEFVWSVVHECIKDINQGYNADAITKYRLMVLHLQEI